MSAADFFSILAPLWPIFLLPLPFFSNCAFCFCFCSGFNPLPAWAGCKTKQKPGHFSQCAVEAPYWKFSHLFVNILVAPFSQIERILNLDNKSGKLKSCFYCLRLFVWNEWQFTAISIMSDRPTSPSEFPR